MALFKIFGRALKAAKLATTKFAEAPISHIAAHHAKRKHPGAAMFQEYDEEEATDVIDEIAQADEEEG